MNELAGLVRVSGEGEVSPRHTAEDEAARIVLVDRELDELAGRDGGGVRIIEIDRDGDHFARLDRFRGGTAAPAGDLVLEFLRVGVIGGTAAAEYVRSVPATGAVTIYATDNPHPSPAAHGRVPYDSCVPLFFPPEAVVSLDTIRRLTRWYAVHGEWPADVPFVAHDDIVAVG